MVARDVEVELMEHSLNPSMPLLIFTAFVIHFITLVFIAGIYGFAFKFLDDRLYVALALGWLINAGYVALEAILLLLNIADQNPIKLAFVTASIGIWSMPFFHSSLKVNRADPESVPHRFMPFLIGAILSGLCQAGVLLIGSVGLSSNWMFAIITLPAALYSAWVLLMVAHRFYLRFPEEEYGQNSRFLYGSWAAYSVLQLFYPYKLFFIDQRALFIFLFIIAFFVKVIGSAALLLALRESYAAAQAETREASVLADIGNVAAGLHHDIANPLAWINSELSLLSQKRAADDIVMKSIEKIRRPVDLISSAIKFVSLIRADPEAIAHNFRRISVMEPISFAIGLFKKRNPNTSMRILRPESRPSLYYIRANNDLLAEAFQNIINNAFEASAQILKIQVRRISDPEPKIEFNFINNGKILSEEERNNCLKPGWSSKDKTINKSNIGMGLYMASKIISIHRGSIHIDNNKEMSGVDVSVILPAARQSSKEDNLKENF